MLKKISVMVFDQFEYDVVQLSAYRYTVCVHF
jgi:hypothetical protein